ncbi:MAG: alpha/beta hydrolase [Bacteroidota bacterium]|nr:alpha/beta hydrolase [Bacteroidota bacterium]MDP4190616.1 alpha/beta hydrolase [Bacteroidota bacterium]
MNNEQDLKAISVNNTQLHYIEQGKGIPIIFVHGSLGDFRTWNFQKDYFSKAFHFISYSRRYHFPNKWTSDGSDYSVALHSRDLSSFIENLGIAPVHLVGNSFGAYVSLYLASENPKLVRSLVLGEPPILPWLEDTKEGKELMKEFINNAFEPAKKAFHEGKMEEGVNFFIDGVLGKGAYGRLPQSVKAQMLENAEEMKAETTSKDYFSPITYKDLEKVDSPVLLLKGEKSPKMFHLIIDKLAEHLPKKKSLSIPNASHSMHTGNPEYYNSCVMEFLKSIFY